MPDPNDVVQLALSSFYLLSILGLYLLSKSVRVNKDLLRFSSRIDRAITMHAFNQMSFFKITDFLFIWRFCNMDFFMTDSYVCGRELRGGKTSPRFFYVQRLFVSIQRYMQINSVESKITQQPQVVLKSPSPQISSFLTSFLTSDEDVFEP